MELETNIKFSLEKLNILVQLYSVPFTLIKRKELSIIAPGTISKRFNTLLRKYKKYTANLKLSKY